MFGVGECMVGGREGVWGGGGGGGRWGVWGGGGSRAWSV